MYNVNIMNTEAKHGEMSFVSLLEPSLTSTFYNVLSEILIDCRVMTSRASQSTGIEASHTRRREGGVTALVGFYAGSLSADV